MYHFSIKDFSIFSANDDEIKAASLFSLEIARRCNTTPAQAACAENANVVFSLLPDNYTNDDYEIRNTDKGIMILAGRRRALFYGYAKFLRKCEFTDCEIILTENIEGYYSPSKRIRGHQIGYRTTPNTYDAWTLDQYYRYYLDLILMECNTVEHIPYERAVSKRNRLMQYDEEDFLVEASRMADDLDLDVSLWFPNCEDSLEDAVKRRDILFSRLPRLNIVFPPGGDPGELEPDELFARCKAFREVLKKHHPDAELWPSAQQPHSMPLWGEAFLEASEKYEDAIDGVITGPNRAFDLDVLRKRLNGKYDIRLYPDITHNVRCEYPVHFDRDDWHYALTTGLSRECINPRPIEYKLIHTLTNGYVIGSVSYSEGINDDVNKFVWSSLDVDPAQSVRDILDDYARLFFVGCKPEIITDAILALEKNWEGDPAENPHIETTLQMWISIGNNIPTLSDNWRYNALLFRACCDVLIRRRLLAETKQLKRAKDAIKHNRIADAISILNEGPDSAYSAMRRTVDSLAEKLFEQIGLQLDVNTYCADNPERGATLDTIDLPITDRLWLLQKIEASESMDEQCRYDYLMRLLNRNKVDRDEYYFSFALDGFSALGTQQKPDFYMNFQGDRPNVNNGSLPVCMFKLYDHFSFSCKCAGFSSASDYVLQITFKNTENPFARHHKVVANGFVIYDGKQFGGYRNTDFENEMLPDGYIAVCYDLPKEVFINGCLELEITEPILGFQFSEFRIVKKL
ncbi:MAG: hypothetical protein IJC45_02190 [Clostridia bacterium]|nr:hypothetical protein [Clostridia bacterium]